MPDSKKDVTKTRNGERGTGGNEKLEQNKLQRIGCEVADSSRVQVGFFFPIVRLIYSFLASREASFHDIRRAGGNFLSPRRIP